MTKEKLFFACLPLLFLALMITGCAPLRPETDPLRDAQANRLATRVKTVNHLILSSKGMAWAKLETPDQTLIYQIAWAAVFPNKLRATFMVSGRPMETIVATGQSVTFVSHTDRHPRYTIASPDPDLSAYLDLPVRLSEIVAILLGRYPIRAHDEAFFSSKNPNKNDVTLFSKNKGPVQILHLDANQKISSLTATDSQKNPVYDYTVLSEKPVLKYWVPMVTKVSDPSQIILTLTITRFDPNPVIKPAVFKLTDPE